MREILADAGIPYAANTQINRLSAGELPHVLDVIAIDSTLALYTARAGSLQLTGPVPLASGTTLYNGVRSSVSGAPR